MYCIACMKRSQCYPCGWWELNESETDYASLSKRIVTGQFGRFVPIPLSSPLHDEVSKSRQIIDYTTWTRLDVEWGEVLDNLQKTNQSLNAQLTQATTLNQSLLAATLQRSLSLSDTSKTRACKMSLTDAVNEKRNLEKMQ